MLINNVLGLNHGVPRGDPGDSPGGIKSYQFE